MLRFFTLHLFNGVKMYCLPKVPDWSNAKLNSQ